MSNCPTCGRPSEFATSVFEASKRALASTPTVVTMATVASAISLAAKNWLSGGLKSFRGDKSMTDAYRKDAQDLRAVAKLVRSGALTAARDSAARLDTIVRDELPESFFELLRKNGVEW